MAWTTPRDWTVGEIVTEAMMDTHVKDNLRYLKGMDGVVTTQSGLIISNALGTEYLTIPSLTTTQRDALTPTAGMMVYNSTTTQFNKYENGAWRADLGYNSAHSGLSGLGSGDDHTQYRLNSLLTTQGDLPYATAASTWARLPKGTAIQLLRMNAGATAPEWWTLPTAVTGGNYSGTSVANRAIAHGLSITPKLVKIIDSTQANMQYSIINGTAVIYYESSGSGFASKSVTAADGTNFYVGDSTDYGLSANLSGRTYQWVAMGN